MNLMNMSSRKFFTPQLRNYISFSKLRFCTDGKYSLLLSSRTRIPGYHSSNSDNYQRNEYELRGYATLASQNAGSVLQRKLGQLTQMSSSAGPAEVVEERTALSVQVKYATNTQDVLQLLEANELKSITVPIVTDASRSLFDLVKADKSPNSRQDVLDSVGMQKLCKVIRYNARFMDAEDILSIVKLFVLLGVPKSHLTFEIVLKLLTKKANSLDLSQIVYIQFLLSKIRSPKSSLVEALEVALPIVFESQLETQLETHDIQRLCDYLHYCSKCEISDKAVEVVVTALLKHDSKTLTPKQSLSIVWSLCDMETNHLYQETLVKLALRNLANNIEVLKPTEVSTTMQKCSTKYAKNFKYFYQEDFVDTVCNRLVSKRNDPIDTLYLFKSISLMRHVNVEFMDRVADIVASDNELVLRNDKRMFFSLVRCFSSCNYKPEKWSTIESVLMDPELSTGTVFGDIEIATHILALGSFPEAMITNLFSEDNMPKLEEYMDRFPYPLSLIILNNAVNLLYKEYNGPRLPNSFFDMLKNKRNSQRNVALKNSLVCAFGGDSYVLNDIFFNGLFIEHGVVLRKGGYPVAINCDNNNTIDLHSINLHSVPESVTVLVKVFFKEAFANNTSRLRGIHALELKVLESLGHPVVNIDITSWSELPDFEKIPYLMSRVKEKVEKFQWNRSCGDVIPS